MLGAGGVIAYPTEAVYGLGCDPLNGHAVHRLLALKRRPVKKGLILIAAHADQLTPYVESLPAAQRAAIEASWPGPVTWLLPAREGCPAWLRGEHETIAVRVTDHPLVAALCHAYGGALVSTSANRAGQPPARSALGVRRIFRFGVDFILHGETGALARPTEIRDACSGRVIRQG